MGIPRMLALGLAVWTGVLVGCRTDKQQSSLATQTHADLSPLSSGSSKPSFASDPKYQKLIKEISGSDSKSTSWDKAIAPVESVGGTLKKAASGVVQKMRPRPRVIPASDPVSLSSKPVKISEGVFYAAGRLAEHNGDTAEAIKQYEKALGVSPTHLPTLISLARLYDRQNRFDDAVANYQKAIKTDPTNATAHNDLGLCFSRHGDLKQSLAELQRAVRIDPKSKLYRNNLATVLVEMGNSDEAWRQLSQVHVPAIAHYNMGYLLNGLDRKDEARHHFALAVRADESLAIAKTMLDRLDAELGRKAPDMAIASAQLGDRKATLLSGRRAKQHRFVSTTSQQQLRRMPPPDLATPVEVAPTPSVPGLTPSPSNPSWQVPQQAPQTGTPHTQPSQTRPPSDSPPLRFPVRPTSGSVSDDPGLEPQLPLPDLLDNSKLEPAEPALLPVP